MTRQAEFSHRLLVERIPAAGTSHRLEAGADARAGLAARFDLEALERLVAEVRVHRVGEAVEAEGALEAEVVQRCVVSGEPVRAQVREAVRLRFVAPAQHLPDEEVELDAAALDELPLNDGTIDLGEAVAQSLALALDPYPRASAEILAAARARLLSEEEADRAARAANPFAGLKAS